MLEEDLNDIQLVETASAITSDLGQSEWLIDRDAQRCRAHFVLSISDENKDDDNHTLYTLHSPYLLHFNGFQEYFLKGIGALCVAGLCSG